MKLKLLQISFGILKENLTDQTQFSYQLGKTVGKMLAAIVLLSLLLKISLIASHMCPLRDNYNYCHGLEETEEKDGKDQKQDILRFYTVAQCHDSCERKRCNAFRFYKDKSEDGKNNCWILFREMKVSPSLPCSASDWSYAWVRNKNKKTSFGNSSIK